MNNKEYDVNSILGFIFGIISIVNINIIFSILGLIFSGIAKKEYENSKMAKIGFTLSIISIVLFICIAIIIALLLIFRIVTIPLN